MKHFLQWFVMTLVMITGYGEALAQSDYYIAYNVSGGDAPDTNMMFPAKPATLVSTDDQGFRTFTFTLPAGTRDQAQFLILNGPATNWYQSYTGIKRYHSGGVDSGNFEITSEPQPLYVYVNNSTTGYLYLNNAARKEHTLLIKETYSENQKVLEVSVDSSTPAEPVVEGKVFEDMYVTYRVDNTSTWILKEPMTPTADGWEFAMPEASEKVEFMISHRNDYSAASDLLNSWWYVQFSAGNKDSADPYDLTEQNGSQISLFPQNCAHYLVINKAGTHTIKLRPVAESSYYPDNGGYTQTANMEFTYTSEAPERLDVFLPLSKSDFYNDDNTRRPHYFLVGTRQGEWRLQPEWELKTGADGRLGIFTPRVMYTGLVGVGMVDNYNDYINGRFTKFTTAGGARYDINTASNALDAGAPFDFYADDEEGSAGLRPDENTAAVLMATAGYVEYNDGSVGLSNGMLAEEIVVGMDADGVTPASLSFKWSADPTADVSKYITFSLVGGGIINDGMSHPSNTVVGRHDWQDAYVQYDPRSGRPYRDAHGMLLYQTCFQSDWMGTHPSFFNKKIGGNDFNYTSQSLLLENVELLRGTKEYEDDPYRAFYERFDATAGAGSLGMVDNGLQTVDVGGFTYKEYMRAHGHAKEFYDQSNLQAYEYGYGGRQASGWKCFVVKDMWMDGYFKIWTGWGGGRKEADKVTLVDPQNARWNNINGGHGHEKCHEGSGGGAYPYHCDEQPADDPYMAGDRDEIRGFDITREGEQAGVYAIFQNVDGADFHIKDLTYFKRVIVWYDPEKGFNNSVVQLLVERGGPAIKAMKGVLGSEINYVWNVPDPYGNLSEQEKLREVSRYTIDRYVYDMDEGVWNIQAQVVSEPLSGVTVADLMSEDAALHHPIQAAAETGLEAGTYRYRVTLSFKDGSQDLYAFSNRVTLYEAEQPVDAVASQRMGTGDEEGAYSFDVVLRLDLSNAAYSEVFDDGSQLFRTTDLVKNYLLKVDEATATALNAATAGPKFTFGTRRVYVDGDMEGQDVEGWFAEVEFPTGNELATKTVQWDNVVKADNYYPFTIYLDPADRFINLFAEAAFGTSSAEMEMVVPEVSLVWVKDAVEKADESLVPEFTAPEEMPMGTHLGSPSEIDAPVHYSRANTLCSYYEFAPQGEVTSSVKENFDVAYMAAAQCAPVSCEIMVPAEPGTLAVRDIDVRAFRLPSSVEIHDGGAYHCPDTDNAPEVYAAADAVYTRKDNPLLLCRATEPVTLRHTVRMPECVAPEFDFALSNGLALTTFELDATDGNRYYVHDLQANIEVTNSAACTGDASAMMPQVAAVGFHLEPKTRTDVQFLSHDGSGVRVPSKESRGGIVAYEGMNNSFFTCMDGYQPRGEYSKDTHNWAEIAFRNPAMNLPVFVSLYSSIQKLPDEGPCPWEKDVPDLFATVAYHYPFLVKENATQSAMLSRAASSPAYALATLTAHTTITRPIAASEIMTGITGVSADSEAPAEWYNLQGIRVAQPVRGEVYILRRGSTAVKVRY